MRIIVFGDSITQGFFDSKGGWLNRLAGETYAKDNNVVTHSASEKDYIFNLGVMSDKVLDVINRFKHETDARFKETEQTIIVLAVGINDSALQDNRVVGDEQDFVREYARLIDMAQDYTKFVVCVGLTAVDEQIIEIWRDRRRGKTWANNRINLFEDCIKQAAMEKNAYFVPLHDAFLKAHQNQQGMVTGDGIHPNDHGHRFIHERVRQALDELVQ